MTDRPEQDPGTGPDAGPHRRRDGRSAGGSADLVEMDYHRAGPGMRRRLAWQVLAWPLALVALIVAGAIWFLA